MGGCRDPKREQEFVEECLLIEQFQICCGLVDVYIHDKDIPVSRFGASIGNAFAVR